MGMDVIGRKPKNEKGEYFRNNIWWWHPLWEYCEIVSPAICGKVEHAHFNDGGGLDDADSVSLASALRAEVESGRSAEYASEYKRWQDSLPREKCDRCGGSGQYEGAKCSACDGVGQTPPWDAQYPFAVENVISFVEFLESCGGFNIC